MPSPKISRRPSVLTATAIIAATETMRPPSRTLEVGGVEPQIRPFALDRPLEEGLRPARRSPCTACDTWLLRDAGQAHRLHQLVDPPGRDAADPGLLDHRDQRLLGGLARLQEGREVASPGAAWGCAAGASPAACRGVALAIAVAVVEPIAGALVPAGADQPLDIGFHQALQHRLRHARRKVAVAGSSPAAQRAAFCRRSSGPRRFGMKSCNSTLAAPR